MTILQDKLINMLRRVVDRHDEKHGLKKRETFQCTSLQRRHDYRREAYRIDLSEAQCPVFLDNRCCGACDLAASCDYATACNCYGFTKGALGGTDEGLYMRVDDYAKYGRIGENGEFDWDYYKLNQGKDKFIPGKYIAVRKLEHTQLPDEVIAYIQDNPIARVVGNLQDDGFLTVNFRLTENDEATNVLIHFLDIASGSVYDSLEFARMLNPVRSKLIE